MRTPSSLSDELLVKNSSRVAARQRAPPLTIESSDGHEDDGVFRISLSLVATPFGFMISEQAGDNDDDDVARFSLFINCVFPTGRASHQQMMPTDESVDGRGYCPFA